MTGQRVIRNGVSPAAATLAAAAIAMAALLATAALQQPPSSARAPAALIGATFVPAPTPPPGLIVTSLRTGGAAATAGLAVGDELLDIDGHPVASLPALRTDLAEDHAEAIGIHVRRDHALVEVRLPRQLIGESLGPSHPDR